ncbi:MAG: hypothetical protein WEA77_00875 [Hyphomonas sp.]|uniref:hypothetical protein n=1 Tax=Hyphomonas sp. TaxID=87 RepID=UPI0034A07142
MITSLWRACLVGLAVAASPLAAGAETKDCTGGLSDAARMSCDLERAGRIRDRARNIYDVQFDAQIEIIDTASPSGAAYLYNVLSEGTQLRLDARSVPDGRGPRCRLQAAIAGDTANAIAALLIKAADAAVPDYGAREDVKVNADGSRSVRLVIDSHDIITRARTASGDRAFSRHSGSDDPVTQLNNLVIGVANVSPDWVCSAS